LHSPDASNAFVIFDGTWTEHQIIDELGVLLGRVFIAAHKCIEGSDIGDIP
jgi:hypothetical protein